MARAGAGPLARPLVPNKRLRLQFAVLTKAKQPAIDVHEVPANPQQIDRTILPHIDGIQSRNHIHRQNLIQKHRRLQNPVLRRNFPGRFVLCPARGIQHSPWAPARESLRQVQLNGSEVRSNSGEKLGSDRDAQPDDPHSLWSLNCPQAHN